MLRYDWRFRTVAPVALCGLIGFAACGDDDSSDDSGAGDAGSSAAGKGGSSAAAGSGGKAGSSAGGTGGKAGSSAGGTGGSAGSSTAGKGGAGGGPAIDYPDLTNAKGAVLADVNALSAVTFAADGKVYAAGDINIIDDSKATGDTAADKYKASVVGHKIVVLRFSADGKPDESFGTNGRVIWEGPANEATTMGLAETDDGSVVVDVNLKYESKRTGVALVKFDETGKLVTGFGSGGRVDLVLGWKDDQVGDYPKDAMGAVRYPADQSWDIKAADGGKKLVVFASGPAAHGLLDEGADPKLQRIDNDRYILRVSASDGKIDSGFNGGKIVVVNTPNDGATGDQPRYPSDGGRHGLVESDGTIVGAGYTGYNDGKGNNAVLIRLKPDGTFDSSFHSERDGQPVLPGVAVFNPVPVDDMGFAECYGVGKTAKGYVTTGYGNAYGGTGDKSSLDYLPSKAVDMVSTRFTGTAVDKSWAHMGVFAAQSEALGDTKVSAFEDRGRSAVIALSDNRAIMGGRFGQYPAIFVLTDEGKLDDKIKGKDSAPNGILLFPALTSDEQPATSLFYGLALSPDGKHLAAGTNNHEQGALLAFLEIKDNGSIATVSE